jgi:hypothetical protein
MSEQDLQQPALPRPDRGWLMRHSGALADEALVLTDTPRRRHRFPRPRPLHLGRRGRLIRAPAI